MLGSVVARWRSASRFAIFLLTLSLVAVPAQVQAQGKTCQLALVLALDASSSVDAREFDLQLRGLAEALADPEIEAAILRIGGVLAMAYEWSGRQQHRIHADWSWLDSPTSIAAFARRITGATRGTRQWPTALGNALGFAATQLGSAPMACKRRVVDVSGDGVNNDGFGPASAYRAFDFEGVTVNGLVIKGAEPDPEAYYRNRVIRGAGAFVEVARDYRDYANAMRRKLLREITGGAIAMLE